MKKVYQLILFLLLSVGLTACGSNSIFEAEATGLNEAVEVKSSTPIGSSPEEELQEKATQAVTVDGIVEDDSDAPETVFETSRPVGSEVPESCKIWFDGCNSCVVLGGKLRGCTRKVCKTPGPASCLN